MEYRFIKAAGAAIAGAGAVVAMALPASAAPAHPARPAAAAHVTRAAQPAKAESGPCYLGSSPFILGSDYGDAYLGAGNEAAVTWAAANGNETQFCEGVFDGTYAPYGWYAGAGSTGCGGTECDLAVEDPPDLLVSYQNESPAPTWESWTVILVNGEWKLVSKYDGECATIYAVSGGYQSELEPCSTTYQRQQNIWLVTP